MPFTPLFTITNAPASLNQFRPLIYLLSTS